MPQSYDLLIKGGVIVNHDGIREGDIGIRGGKIARIGAIGGAPAETELDARGLHVFPGVIDSHVHFREPGGETREDLESGSRAAVLGGVTAIFEMPNTNPPTVTAEALADKIARATGRMFCDFAFYPGATKENIEQLRMLESLPGAAGIKVFMGSSTGNLLVDDPATIRALLGKLRRRAAFHCEDEARLNARKALQIHGDPSSHSVWRDAQAAFMATDALLRMAREAGARVHILHVSTGEEMALIAQNRDIATAEVTPHHLLLPAKESYARLGSRAQMNPPLREADQVAALWDAVAQGVADTVGSDHAPHLVEDKARAYPDSPSGMPGVQTLTPLLLNAVSEGRLSLLRFADLTSHGPARVYGIAGKGRIAAGYDADFTLADLRKTATIDDSWIESRCGWTPYAGQKLTGWPSATVIRGRIVMREGEILGEPAGRQVRFLETLRNGALPEDTG